MKRFRIWFWHGHSGFESKFVQKVAAICSFEGEIFYFDGTLEEFAEKWNDKFIYMPTNKDSTWEFPLLCVTQFNSFGAR